jgi:MFS transporter, FSR family, fosmidomycin resistance protein
MCLIGLAPTYGILALILIVSGASVSTLHIATPVLVSHVSGPAMGRGMSFFQVGGELARTVGPLVAVWAVSVFGLEGLWQLAPMAVAASLILLWRVRRIPEPEAPRRVPSLVHMVKGMRRILFVVLGVMVARSFLVAGTTTFLPTYLFEEGHGLWFSGIAFSLFELAGACGVLVAGWVSDRLGRRRTLLVISVLAPPLVVLFLLVEGWLVVPLLLAMGFVTLSTSPVLLAAVMEHAGENRAAANGTFMAISFAIRSLVILIVGLLGDTCGLWTTFLICACIAAVGIPFVLLMPRDRRS